MLKGQKSLLQVHYQILNKKVMKILVSLFFILLNSSLYCQNIDEFNRINSENIMKKYFPDSQKSYLLYNIDKYYLVIIKDRCSYKQYFINDYLELKSHTSIPIKNKIIDQAFQVKLSPCNFIYSVSDSIQRFGSFPALPKYNYMVVKRENIKIIEFNLPVLFMPFNRKRFPLPISNKLHGYLIEQVHLHTKEN